MSILLTSPEDKSLNSLKLLMDGNLMRSKETDDMGKGLKGLSGLQANEDLSQKPMKVNQSFQSVGPGTRTMKKVKGKRYQESNMQLDSSGLNISDQISVNIKYDSFTEEASKFKINSLSKEGGIGPVAEPRNPRPHHHM